jgi:hypothetical protein
LIFLKELIRNSLLATIANQEILATIELDRITMIALIAIFKIELTDKRVIALLNISLKWLVENISTYSSRKFCNSCVRVVNYLVGKISHLIFLHSSFSFYFKYIFMVSILKVYIICSTRSIIVHCSL